MGRTYRRITTDRIKKWAIGAGITGGVMLLLFSYLVFLGDINVTDYSGDSVCAGDLDDPCYAYINFTMNKYYIYLYPSEDWYFYTDVPIKELKFQVKDGRMKEGWRTIDLTEKSDYCKKKGCGYAYRFYASKGLWEIRFVGYKNSPGDVIKWGFGEIDPVWMSSLGNKFIVNYG